MNGILNKPSFDPKELVSFLKENMSLQKEYEFRVRHYTLEQHTLLVMNEFEKYFAKIELPIDIGLFRLLLCLHDIGKPKAFREGDKNKQYQNNKEIIYSLKDSLPFNDKEITLCMLIVGSDILGLYFQNQISLKIAKKMLLDLSSEIELPIFDLLKLMTTYYQCDIGSYTKDAGGLSYLEHLFEYQDGLKLFDSDKERLKFSPKYEVLYTNLENSLK
ncbi:hypothetical protein HCG69_10970 [Bacteroides sp. K03]|uniref:hypothetical protein n=1 Tax=Bacteroides sp. K03 TaxID=2718928 RepID=UPI001C8CC44D|nr:hypothetical protein [Bacteroides sp. K03]MBX9188589.1 hypothetical protein [Bacteroides sp. K03]